MIVTRKKGGVRYDLNLSDSWKGYASYTLEQREGARPFGAVWGPGPGTAPLVLEAPDGTAQTGDERLGLVAGRADVAAAVSFEQRE